MPTERIPYGHQVTVIIPTFREPGIGSLLEELDAACVANSIDAEFLVVDDTPDTSTIAAAGAAAVVNSVTTIHRPTRDVAWGGLAGAVVDGICQADAPIVVVMDGDGQHPVSVVPTMVRFLSDSGIDMVVASRYTDGGNAEGLDGGWRHGVSSLSTGLARWLFPRRVGARTTDPMTGFFAVRTDVIDPDLVTRHAIGFKILLAILATHPSLRVAEVPFLFGERHDGESKASVKNGLAFLRQITKMRFTV